MASGMRRLVWPIDSMVPLLPPERMVTPRNDTMGDFLRDHPIWGVKSKKLRHFLSHPQPMFCLHGDE